MSGINFMAVLNGDYQPTEGEYLLDGVQKHFNTHPVVCPEQKASWISSKNWFVIKAYSFLTNLNQA